MVSRMVQLPRDTGALQCQLTHERSSYLSEAFLVPAVLAVECEVVPLILPNQLLLLPFPDPWDAPRGLFVTSEMSDVFVAPAGGRFGDD
jgi:hypothetical protein